MVATGVNAHDLFRGLFTGGHHVDGSGKIISEDRDVPSFTKIEVSMGVDVTVNVGKTQKVTLAFDDNLIDLIKTRVRGGTLEIYSRESFSSDSDCRIEITVPELDGFDLSGSGNIEIHNLAGKEFSLDLSGSGDIILDGKTSELDISLSGSGNVDARDLTADEASVDVAGSGNVSVRVLKELDASVAGSGDIEYYGNPEDVNTDVAGSGSIRRRKG
jgi:hypothetical protein